MEAPGRAPRGGQGRTRLPKRRSRTRPGLRAARGRQVPAPVLATAHGLGGRTGNSARDGRRAAGRAWRPRRESPASPQAQERRGGESRNAKMGCRSSPIVVRRLVRPASADCSRRMRQLPLIISSGQESCQAPLDGCARSPAHFGWPSPQPDPKCAEPDFVAKLGN